jgi:hypothetical protein
MRVKDNAEKLLGVGLYYIKDEECGFVYSHTIKDFFTKNYNHKMFEDGRQLIDMIYLKIEFGK